jgi:hypothetical protein
MDLEPRKPPVDGLVDRGRRIDRSTIGLDALVPALASEIVGFTDQRLTGARGQDAGHRARLRQLLGERLAARYPVGNKPWSREAG